MQNPAAAIGLLHRGVPSDQHFLGTCFAYQRGTRFLTAAHCVQGIPVDEIYLTAPQHGLAIGGGGLEVRPHSTMDLAVILRPGMMLQGQEIEPFDLLLKPQFGQDVWAFGFPADALGAGRHEPRERLFKGHIQRVIPEYTSPATGRTFDAVELSFPSPAGLSGGPIFAPIGNFPLLGVVTDNVDSKTYLEESEEVVRDGSVEKTLYQKVVSYGVAADLSQAVDWLNKMAPPPLGENPNATIVGETLPED